MNFLCELWEKADEDVVGKISIVLGSAVGIE